MRGEVITIAQQIRKKVRRNIPAEKSPAVDSLIISLSEQHFGAIHKKFLCLNNLNISPAVKN